MDVQKAAVYSTLADECKDCSKREKLAIVVRYVDVDTATVFERFLTYVEATSLNAENLSSYILDTLKQNELDPRCIVYDGASVMSGHCTVIQQCMKEVAPHAAMCIAMQIV